jgi:hypothetical protein
VKKIRRRKPAAARKRNNLTFRTRDQLRAQLEKVAAAAGRSVSEEIEYRLTLSFSHDDAFGDPAMRRIAILMATTFHNAGNLRSLGKPVAQWIDDPGVFRSAMFGTIYALFKSIPGITAKLIDLEFDSLKGRLQTEIANGLIVATSIERTNGDAK